MIFGSLSFRGCGGQPLALLWNIRVKSQMPIPPEHAFIEKSTKLLILLPLRKTYNRTFQCETPCSRNKHFFTKSCHRQTYQNYEQPPQTSQNLYFQSHFSVLKIGWIFPKKKSIKNIRLGDQLLLKDVFENFDFLDTLFSKFMPNFCRLCS
jgi:hypothetical protein